MPLDWMKRHGSPAHRQAEAATEAAQRHGCAMSGEHSLLYKYLENRYANTVVLTFAEIEDILGFALPDPARVSRGVVDGRRFGRSRNRLRTIMDSGPSDGHAESAGPDRCV